MNFLDSLSFSMLYTVDKLENREKTQTPQKSHSNAETKPGQDTEGQCSTAELFGRLMRLVSVFTT